MVRSLEEIQREKARKGPKILRIYLVGALFFLGLAVAAYVFETELAFSDFNQLDDFGAEPDNLRFLMALTVPIILALLCVYCYRVPRVGLKLLGYTVELRDEGERLGGVTYDIFQGETGSDQVLQHSRRKQARHTRRKVARETMKMEAEAKAKADDDPGDQAK